MKGREPAQVAEGWVNGSFRCASGAKSPRARPIAEWACPDEAMARFAQRAPAAGLEAYAHRHRPRDLPIRGARSIPVCKRNRSRRRLGIFRPRRLQKP